MLKVKKRLVEPDMVNRYQQLVLVLQPSYTINNCESVQLSITTVQLLFPWLGNYVSNLYGANRFLPTIKLRIIRINNLIIEDYSGWK